MFKMYSQDAINDLAHGRNLCKAKLLKALTKILKTALEVSSEQNKYLNLLRRGLAIWLPAHVFPDFIYLSSLTIFTFYIFYFIICLRKWHSFLLMPVKYYQLTLQ